MILVESDTLTLDNVKLPVKWVYFIHCTAFIKAITWSLLSISLYGHDIETNP
jgi:hypothetical protein